MAKVVIVGGAFAGLAAAEVLAGKPDVDLELYDPLPAAEFKPLLPDIVGRELRPALLQFDIARHARRTGYRFFRQEVASVDTLSRRIRTADGERPFDFLIMAAGSGVGYFGRTDFEQNALPFHSIRDALAVLARLEDSSIRNLVVIGGGYTGIEVATHLRLHADRHGMDRRVAIVERAPRVLPDLPERLSSCAAENMRRMGIQVLANTMPTRMAPGELELSNGERIFHTLVVWAAYVQASRVAREMAVPKGPHSRITVGPDLSFAHGCFACGDAAAAEHNGMVVRLSVQLSISGGRMAARNVLRAIRGLSTEEYIPHDPGLIVPMANGRSCGEVMGRHLSGRLPTFLHYFMSLYRTRGIMGRLDLLRALGSAAVGGGGSAPVAQGSTP